MATLEPTSDEKTGRTTVKLRVVGPRDRADDLVQNLEHSKHFLLPGIVGESSEATATGGQADRLEPVSASNRFTFELQAEYNPDAAVERKAQKRLEDKKPSAGEEGAGQRLKSNAGGAR